MSYHYNAPPVRVYTADELDDAPQDAIDRACRANAEAFDPQWVTDAAVESFNALHRDDHGIELESGKAAGPFWSVGGQDDGASLTVGVHDFAAYLRWRKADHHVARRLLWLYEQGDVCLAFKGREGRYCGTVAVVLDYAGAFTPGEADRNAAVDWLRIDADGVATDLEYDFIHSVRADYEYAGSIEQLDYELRDLDRGLTEDGETVDLIDCEEEANA